MAKIISIAHQKGGVGKTTLAVNLAYCFKESMRLGLIDLDVQGSLSGLKETLSTLSMEETPKKISSITTLPYDLIIVDTPPYLSSNLPELFNISDFILIPTKAGFLDTMAIRGTIDLVNAAQKLNSKIKAGIILNMVKPNTGLTEDVKNLLKSYNLPVLDSVISDRVSFTRSVLLGGVLNGEDHRAKDEILNLADEIFNIMGF